ncbi:hypothetical protein K491DRAFT_215817 [Lophiostoma macrostomum CBS 122681]|uniref:Uncharacterized protein n=1 Tax=Lophiostoma macrostomum CBS 122681 TaxID=1314788 RepID=A0A6A6TJG0_9PLEO|nr:hypothetical protein K491DRAFT_215817 [Lophiostoma macrostomum CBS 122681]
MTMETALLHLGCLEFAINEHLQEGALLNLNEIHTLFAPSNWLPVPTEELCHQAYMNMRPALALATKLITSKEMMNWWMHALYGNLSRHKKSGRIYLADDYRELDTKQAKLEVDAKFSEVAEKIRFYWMPPVCIDRKESLAGMASYSPYDVMSHLDEAQFPTDHSETGRFLPTIGLDVQFLHHLVHSPGTPALSHGSNLRLQFYIAIVLVHELAHVIWMMVSWKHSIEPYFYLNDDMPEAGYSWENHVFGCHVSPYPFDRERIGPVCSSSFDEIAAFPSIYIPQPMAWVRMWFLEETWKDLHAHRAKMQPTVHHKLPDCYQGVFFADRYSRRANIWVRVLYKDRKAYAVQGSKVLDQEAESGKLAVAIRLGTVPPKQSLAKWFEITRVRDVQRAKERGWPDEEFHVGRSRDYELSCYDGKGTPLGDDDT